MDVNRFGFDPSHGYFVQRPDGYYVMTADFDRVTAERDALQQRLNEVEEENDRLRTLLDRSIPYLNNTPDLVQHGAEELASEIRSGLGGRPCYGPNEWSTECGKCEKCTMEKRP